MVKKKVSDESKRERFIRLATKRTQNVVNNFLLPKIHEQKLNLKVL